jgi:hypothetical protein
MALSRENLRPLMDSPAAQSLGWAERSLPVFATSGAVDSCPLARAPHVGATSSLPPAPSNQLGGMRAQRATSAVLFLGAGLTLLVFRPRRRETA